MNFPETTDSKPSWMDLYSTKRAVKKLQRIITCAESLEPTKINFCVRPMRELSKLEDEYRQVYGRDQARWPGVPRSTVTFARSEEGTGLYYASARFLAYQSHRFIFGSDGEVSYHQEAYNVDSQAIESPPLNLQGVEAITQNPRARKELLWLSHQLAGMKSEHLEIGKVAIQAC